MSSREALSDLLRQARIDAEISQVELARRLGMSQAAISQWETGSRSPTIEDLYRLANELGTDILDLLPRAQKRSTARAALRAVVAGLEWSGMKDELEDFLAAAEEAPRPERIVESRSSDPVEAAARLLADLGIDTAPVDVKDVATMCGIPIVTLAADPSLSGLVVELDHGPVIGVNSSEPESRQRFSIAHELGHFILNHLDTFHVDLSTSSKEGDPPGYNWRHERAANTFAANLLMPEDLVSKAYVDDSSVHTLAGIFEVSVTAMGFRLRNLRLQRN